MSCTLVARQTPPPFPAPGRSKADMETAAATVAASSTGRVHPSGSSSLPAGGGSAGAGGASGGLGAGSGGAGQQVGEEGMGGSSTTATSSSGMGPLQMSGEGSGPCGLVHVPGMHACVHLRLMRQAAYVHVHVHA